MDKLTTPETKLVAKDGPTTNQISILMKVSPTRLRASVH